MKQSSTLTSLISFRVIVRLLLRLSQLGRNEWILHVEQSRDSLRLVHDEIVVSARVAIVGAVDELLLRWKVPRRRLSIDIRCRRGSVHC